MYLHRVCATCKSLMYSARSLHPPHSKLGWRTQPFFSLRLRSNSCCCFVESDEYLTGTAFLTLQLPCFLGQTVLECVAEPPASTRGVALTAPVWPHKKSTATAGADEPPPPTYA